MFFWISLAVLVIYYSNGLTTIGPGLFFCCMAMVAKATVDSANMLGEVGSKLITTIKTESDKW